MNRSEPEASGAGAVLGMIAVATAASLWGSNHVIARAIHEAVPLLALIFLRWAIALAILTPCVWPTLRREAAVIRAHLGWLFSTGTIGVGLFSILLLAAAYETLALQVGLLGATTPIWVMLLGFLTRQEPLVARRVVGGVIGLMGVVILMTQGELMRLGAIEWRRGDLWAVLSAVVFAWFSLRLRRKPAGLSQTSLTTVLGAFGLVVMIVPLVVQLALAPGPLVAALEASDGWIWFAILYIGIGPTLGGNLLWNIGVGRIGPGRAGPFLYMAPLVSSLLAVAWLGEALRLYHLAGAVPIILGLVLVSRAGSTTSRAEIGKGTAR